MYKNGSVLTVLFHYTIEFNFLLIMHFIDPSRGLFLNMSE